MPTPEQPRYTKESTGESTDHARTVAESTQTELDQLSETIKNAIPTKTNLNMTEHVIKAGESITKVLKKALTGKVKYENKRLLLLSYAHMFKQADTKGKNINLIDIGDKLSITNGKLTITRLDGSSFKVDIYPWENTTQQPEATSTDEPEQATTTPDPVPLPEVTQPKTATPVTEVKPGKTEPIEVKKEEKPKTISLADAIGQVYITPLNETWDIMKTWEMDQNPEHTTNNNPFYRDEGCIKFEKDSWYPDPKITIILKSNDENTDKISEIISTMNKKWQTLQE